MMKKALLILLAALICFGSTACRKKEADETTKSGKTSSVTTSDRGSDRSTTVSTEVPIITTAPTPTDPTPKPNPSDAPIFSEGNISVYFRSVTNDLGSKNINIFVTNSGDRSVSIELQLMTVNRYTIQRPEYIDLIPQSAANVSFLVSNSKLEAVGITELSQITEITVQISARDANLNRVIDEQLITFKVK